MYMQLPYNSMQVTGRQHKDGAELHQYSLSKPGNHAVGREKRMDMRLPCNSMGVPRRQQTGGVERREGEVQAR